jgi:hypothetical protein
VTALSLNFYSPDNGNAARSLAPIAAAQGFEYWRCPDCRYCLNLNLKAAANRCSHPLTPEGALIDGVEWEEGGDFCLDFEPKSGEAR